VAAIDRSSATAAPLIGTEDFHRVSPLLDIWDAWPLQEPGGAPAKLPDGSTLWMALAASRHPDPDERHAHARIHLVQRVGGGWRPLGPAMPDGFSPGSREWSGSAVFDREEDEVVLYFTAAGRRGESEVTFEQRIFSARARLDFSVGVPRLVDWRNLTETVTRDPAYYMDGNEGLGSVGTIKAFRDPAFFRDSADGTNYLLFAGSAAGSTSDYNGVVGLAREDSASPTGWRTLPPLISADGVNNELERPHVVFSGGLYYLFWSTQAHVFNPDGPIGPTGLYGMTAHSIGGPWRPLNGSALVFANPLAAPQQAYSWFVMPDLTVISFVDNWGGDGQPGSERRFGGTFAPDLRLALDGETATLKA
jgi:levansucrase